LRDQRREKETKAEKEKQAVDYPEWSALRKEEQEEKAQLLWVIKDANGKEVRKILSQPSKGISRTTWNLRMESTSPVNPKKRKPGRYETADDGQLVIAGRYTVEVFMLKEGNLTSLSTPVSFEVKNLNNHALPAMNKEALLAFRQEVSEMHRKVSGSAKLMNETKEKLDMMKYAIQTYPSTDLKLLEELRQLRLMYDSCSQLIYGDRLKASKEFETPPSFASRLDYINYQLFESSSGVTQTQRDNLKIVNEEYVAFRQVLDLLVKRTNAVAEKLDEMGIPYTQGKNERWKEN
jgi:hypothetical protein